MTAVVVSKWGNSLAVRSPAPLALTEAQTVDMLAKGAAIQLRAARPGTWRRGTLKLPEDCWKTAR